MSDQQIETEVTDNQDDFDLEVGFGGNESNELDTTTTPDKVEDEPEVNPEPETTPEPTPEPQPAVEFAQITKQQFDDLMAKVSKFDELQAESKRMFDTAFGRIGGLKQLLDAKQAETRRGEPVELTEEDLKELDEYPELSGHLKSVLKRFAGKVTGTGSVDTSAIEGIVNHALQSVRTEVEERNERRFLSIKHRDWKQVKDSPEFAEWLRTKPVEFVVELAGSWNADFVGDAISEFKESRSQLAEAKAKAEQEAQAKEQASKQRQSVLEAAVTPRSSGSQQSSKSADELLDEGFNS